MPVARPSALYLDPSRRRSGLFHALERIKTLFSPQYLRAGGKPGEISTSKIDKGELGVWQRRFWEHTIRDREDLRRRLDYPHYNPVKHGLVRSVME